MLLANAHLDYDEVSYHEAGGNHLPGSFCFGPEYVRFYGWIHKRVTYITFLSDFFLPYVLQDHDRCCFTLKMLLA